MMMRKSKKRIAPDLETKREKNYEQFLFFETWRIFQSQGKNKFFEENRVPIFVTLIVHFFEPPPSQWPHPLPPPLLLTWWWKKIHVVQLFFFSRFALKLIIKLFCPQKTPLTYNDIIFKFFFLLFAPPNIFFYCFSISFYFSSCVLVALILSPVSTDSLNYNPINDELFFFFILYSHTCPPPSPHLPNSLPSICLVTFSFLYLFVYYSLASILWLDKRGHLIKQ